jgi:hypothetical protein
MFDLNEAIRQWRQALAAQPGFRNGDLEELEDHLRESVTELESSGLSREEAFLIASRRLGKPEDLGSEFAIADPDHRRRFRLRWMVVGALALVFLWLGVQASTTLLAGAVGRLAGPDSPFSTVGAGWLIGLTRLLLVLGGIVFFWHLLATDGSSRRLRAMGPGSILAAGLVLAFLTLILRLGNGLIITRMLPHPGATPFLMANAWVNMVMLLLLPGFLLAVLWKLLRRH